MQSDYGTNELILTFKEAETADEKILKHEKLDSFLERLSDILDRVARLNQKIQCSTKIDFSEAHSLWDEIISFKDILTPDFKKYLEYFHTVLGDEISLLQEHKNLSKYCQSQEKDKNSVISAKEIIEFLSIYNDIFRTRSKDRLEANNKIERVIKLFYETEKALLNLKLDYSHVKDDDDFVAEGSTERIVDRITSLLNKIIKNERRKDEIEKKVKAVREISKSFDEHSENPGQTNPSPPIKIPESNKFEITAKAKPLNIINKAIDKIEKGEEFFTNILPGKINSAPDKTSTSNNKYHNESESDEVSKVNSDSREKLSNFTFGDKKQLVSEQQAEEDKAEEVIPQENPDKNDQHDQNQQPEVGQIDSRTAETITKDKVRAERQEAEERKDEEVIPQNQQNGQDDQDSQNQPLLGQGQNVQNPPQQVAQQEDPAAQHNCQNDQNHPLLQQHNQGPFDRCCNAISSFCSSLSGVFRREGRQNAEGGEKDKPGNTDIKYKKSTEFISNKNKAEGKTTQKNPDTKENQNDRGENDKPEDTNNYNPFMYYLLDKKEEGNLEGGEREDSSNKDKGNIDWPDMVENRNYYQMKSFDKGNPFLNEHWKLSRNLDIEFYNKSSDYNKLPTGEGRVNYSDNADFQTTIKAILGTMLLFYWIKVSFTSFVKSIFTHQIQEQNGDEQDQNQPLISPHQQVEEDREEEKQEENQNPVPPEQDDPLNQNQHLDPAVQENGHNGENNVAQQHNKKDKINLQHGVRGGANKDFTMKDDNHSSLILDQDTNSDFNSQEEWIELSGVSYEIIS